MKNHCPKCGGDVTTAANKKGLINWKCAGNGDDPKCKAGGYFGHAGKKKTGETPQETIAPVSTEPTVIKPATGSGDPEPNPRSTGDGGGVFGTIDKFLRDTFNY